MMNLSKLALVALTGVTLASASRADDSIIFDRFAVNRVGQSAGLEFVNPKAEASLSSLKAQPLVKVETTPATVQQTDSSLTTSGWGYSSTIEVETLKVNTQEVRTESQLAQENRVEKVVIPTTKVTRNTEEVRPLNGWNYAKEVVKDIPIIREIVSFFSFITGNGW